MYTVGVFNFVKSHYPNGLDSPLDSIVCCNHSQDYGTLLPQVSNRALVLFRTGFRWVLLPKTAITHENQGLYSKTHRFLSQRLEFFFV